MSLALIKGNVFSSNRPFRNIEKGTWESAAHSDSRGNSGNLRESYALVINVPLASWSLLATTLVISIYAFRESHDTFFIRQVISLDYARAM